MGIDIKDVDEIEIINQPNGDCLIFIKLKREEESCPYCKESIYSLKEWRTRKIKHALFFDHETTFILKVPRYKCLSCNKTFMGKNNYAPKRSRKSYGTITDVLKSLMLYNQTNESVADTYHLTPTTIQNIFDSYVNPKRKSLTRVISIDEFYNKNQFFAPYSVLIFDFLKRKVIDVIQDRKKSNLNAYFCKMLKEEKDKVEYVVMDMWEPYLDIANNHFPNAIKAIDSFHVMQNISKAVDAVRCRIMRGYSSSSIEYYLLKKYHYLLFENPAIYKEKMKIHKLNKYLNEYDLLKMILDIHKDLKTVHEYYIRYKNFNNFATYDSAKEGYYDIATVIDGNLVPEMIPVLSMMTNWGEFIINSFIKVDGIRLSNGPIEGANSQIKKLIKVGNGFSNFLRFRNRIMHCYNKELKISPVSEKIPKIKRKLRGKYNKKSVKN